jgi:ligand-binding sensor domain-containing protein/two-component sensor histidine kinase
VFDETSNSFISLRWGDNFSTATDRISSAFADKGGSFWIGYESGRLLRYTTSSNVLAEIRHSIRERIVDFTQDHSGNIYMASVSGQVSRIDITSHFSQHLILGENCKDLISFLEDISAISDKSLWLGTSGTGLLLLDLDSGNCSKPNFINQNKLDIGTAHIHDIYIDPATKSTWVGSDQGLYRIDKQLQISLFSLENSNLTDNEVASIEPYGDGTLWIGTYRGLDYLVPTVFESYDHSTNTNLRSVVAIDGADWIGNVIATYNGIFLFDSSSKLHQNITDLWPEWNLQNNQIMSINVMPDGMWVGYRSAGLEFLSLDRSRKVRRWRSGWRNSLSVDAVSSVLPTKNGKVLVGTYGGGLNIVSIDGATELYSIGNDRVIMLYQTTSGTIWVGTESGLFTFNPTTGIAEEIELARSEKSFQTKPIIWDMLESDDGVLWLASMHHGIFVWDPKLNQKKPSSLPTLISSSSDIFSSVYSLEIDDFGHIWSSTDSGLVRINAETKQAQVFSQQHGLQVSEFDFGVAHKDNSGFIYFGGSEGYTRFNPANLTGSQTMPQISFTRISSPSAVEQTLSRLRQITRLQLTHKDYFVQFDFSVLDFLDPEKNEYRYMLEGFDPVWIENGTRNSATYTSLPPGQYTLRVQGANSAGIWNREGLSLDIEVLPPPWKTWWAYLSYAVLAIFLGWLGKRAYDSYVVERRATELAKGMVEAEERADDEMQEQLEIHDDLVKSVYRHSVSTLNLLGEVIDIKGSSLSEQGAREVTDGNIKRVAALALLEDCLYYQNELLLADLNKFTDTIISRLLQDSPVPEETVTTINEVSSRPLSFEQASPLAIAMYELLENAIQHAFEGAGPHYLHVILAHQTSAQPGSDYRLTIEDNGLGIPGNIDPLSSQTPGLAIVASMVQRLSGEINYTIDKGTLVTITFHCRES